MTTRLTRLAAMLVAVLLAALITAPTASAQLPNCADATRFVQEFEAELAAAQAALVTSEGVLAAEQAELDALPAPDEDAVASAQASFDAADAGFEAELPELLEFNPLDYPGDVVPTLEQLRDRAFLVSLLPESGAGSTLGEGAQNEVNEAIDAHDVRVDALANLEFTQDAAEAAQAAIDAQELVVLDAQGDVADDRIAVLNLNNVLARARGVQAQVCPAPTATPTPSATATVVPVQTVAKSGELPRTGGPVDARFLAGIGALILAAGAGLAFAARTRRGSPGDGVDGGTAGG